jgi:hypothetical protein
MVEELINDIITGLESHLGHKILKFGNATFSRWIFSTMVDSTIKFTIDGL